MIMKLANYPKRKVDLKMKNKGHIEEIDGKLYWKSDIETPKKYSYKRENTRRHKQINKGIIQTKEVSKHE